MKNLDVLTQDLEVVHVRNLPSDASQTEIQELFAQYGVVHSVMLLTQKDAEGDKRFGWVVMKQAEEAIKALNGASLDGHRLRVQLMGFLLPHKQHCNEMSYSK